MLVKLGNKYLLLKNIISCFFALPQGEQDKAMAYKYTLTVIKKIWLLSIQWRNAEIDKINLVTCQRLFVKNWSIKFK